MATMAGSNEENIGPGKFQGPSLLFCGNLEDYGEKAGEWCRFFHTNDRTSTGNWRQIGKLQWSTQIENPDQRQINGLFWKQFRFPFVPRQPCNQAVCSGRESNPHAITGKGF
jgi:hypothetical protein